MKTDPLTPAEKIFFKQGTSDMHLSGDECTFKLNQLNVKDATKILLHLKQHGSELFKAQPKLTHAFRNSFVVEVEPILVASYFEGTQTLFVSTHAKNEKGLKELLYHFLTCECQLNEIVNAADSPEDAAKRLGMASIGFNDALRRNQLGRHHG